MSKGSYAQAQSPNKGARSALAVELAALNVAVVGVDASTGKHDSLILGAKSFGLSSVTGRRYTTINLPLNQSAGAPTDHSGNGVTSAFGLSNIAPWNWPGYFTAAPNASGSALKPEAAVFNLNFATDSFVLGFTLVKPITGSADTIAGSGNGTSAPGFNVIVGTTGLLGCRLVSSAGTSYSGKYGSAVVGGGAVGASVNASAHVVGATTINLAAAGKGAFTAGDQIKIGTDPNQYVVGTGDAECSNGGSILIPAPGLLREIAINTSPPITIVGGGRVHRCLWAWDAVLKTVYQYVDGVLDFGMAADQELTASELQTLGFWLGQANNGASSLSQFAGFQFLKFAEASLPINLAEMAVQDNLKRRTGLMDVPVFP